MIHLHATEVGRRVALSGLLPQTAHFLLEYLAANNEALVDFLPDENGQGGDSTGLNYCLLCAALVSPEFSGLTRTRFIHFGFEAPVQNPYASRWASLLADQPWQAHRPAVNAAALMVDWIEGASLPALEGRFQGVRAGTVEGLCREVVWCLSGLSDIVAAATRADAELSERPICLRTTATQSLHNIRHLLPSLRLLTWRLNVGMPETVLWLTEAQGSNGRPLVSRREALALHGARLGTYVSLRIRNNWNEMIAALQAAGVSDAQSRAKLIQELANNWHLSLRDKAHARQVRRAGSNNASLFKAYYESRGVAFEHALEMLLQFANIKFTHYDVAPRQGAFDYLLHVDGRPDLPLESKSKQGDSLVPLNEITDVLRATEIHGFAGAQCITLCQPGVDPNAAAILRGCARLCIVEAHDLAEVLVQVANKRAAPQDLYDWLSQPGQAQLATFTATTPAADF